MNNSGIRNHTEPNAKRYLYEDTYMLMKKILHFSITKKNIAPHNVQD